MTAIVIPAEIDGLPVTSIGKYAFYCCFDLKSVIIPDSILSIDAGTFACSGLTAIEIPDSVTSIGDKAFCQCRLTSITIPKNVKNIAEGAFNLCEDLENITVDENNTNYSSVDGVLFNKNKTKIIRYPSVSSEISYQIPETVIEINCCAFNYNKNLSEVIIPEGVKTIGGLAFWDCIALESVVLPDSVENLGGGLFSGCSSLKSAVMPESIETAENDTDVGYYYTNCKGAVGRFAVCENLSSVNIPDGVTVIPSAEFSGCTNLKSIDIPESVISINGWAFRNCDSLTSVTIPESVTSIWSGAFGECDNLAEIKILNSECEIGGYASTISNGYNTDYYFNGTIYGYENSTAQAYAEKWGYNFEVIT